ncbi:MAG: NAD-dependent epimerase/dehydratase family protein [Anaerolineales bacterium]|nr:NAD-dependent epimerase/dehydratase family protein [Anaerolineales bacterium]
MNVLIIGGAGFVGSQIAYYLHDKGFKVSIMDNLSRRGSELHSMELQRRGMFLHWADIRNLEDFYSLPKNIDVICLAAAQPSVVYGYKNPRFDITNNTMGVINTLEFARQRGCGVIYWSTNKVYSANYINAFPLKETEKRWIWDYEKIMSHNIQGVGFNPKYGFSENLNVDGGQHTIYGLSKLMGDLACQEYFNAFGVPTVVNRFGCLAGPGQFGRSEQGWVTWFVIAFLIRRPLTIFGWKGKQVRDILFVDDVCRLIELQLNNFSRIKGEVFNVGGGHNNTLSLLEAVERLEEQFDRRVDVDIIDAPRKADHCVYISDIRKVSVKLNWKPVTGLQNGLENIIRWIRENDYVLKAFIDD